MSFKVLSFYSTGEENMAATRLNRFRLTVILTHLLGALCLIPVSSPAHSPAVDLLLSSGDKIKLVKAFSGSHMYYSLAPVIFDNQLWFTGVDEEHGQELWRSDGTAAGTVMAADINPGQEDSIPLFMTVFNDALYFFAADNSNGFELRKTSWDAALGDYRTVLVKNIGPGSANGASLSSQPVIFLGKLFFVADDGVTGEELWSSDGTPSGTKRVTDIAAGAGDSAPQYLTVLPKPSDPITGDLLLFSAIDGSNGRELWHLKRNLFPFELTASRVEDICSGSCSGSPRSISGQQGFTLYDGDLYFSADDGTHGKELWKTNGFLAGTAMVKDIHPTAGGIKGNGFGAEIFDGELFFVASDDTSTDLWKTDGTEAGTVQAFNLPTTSNYDTYVNYVHNNDLYFSTLVTPPFGDTTHTFWKRYYDTASMSWQSVAVADMMLYPGNYLLYTLAIELNHAVYYTGLTFDDPASPFYNLYKLPDNREVKHINRGIPLTQDSAPNGYVLYKNEIYFFGSNDDHPLMLLKLSPQ